MSLKQELKSRPGVVEFDRVGQCTNCGDCCLFTHASDVVSGNITSEQVRCEDYAGSKPLHCTKYTSRPKQCRDFPSRPADLAGRPKCGFYFVDAQGRVLEPYEDPVFRKRLSILSWRAIKSTEKSKT